MTIMTALTTTSMHLTKGGDDLVVTGKEHLITKFDGWSQIMMRRSTKERLIGDGDISEAGSKAGKIISIGGESIFDTELEAREFEKSLSRFLAEGQRGELVVTDVILGVTLTLYVELNTYEEPVILGNTVGWAYELYAADPAKYGETVEEVAAITVTPGAPLYQDFAKNETRVINNTSQVGYPIFYLSSQDSGDFLITELTTGAVIYYDNFWLAGYYLTINSQTQTATMSGTSSGDRTSNLRNPAPQWHTIPPGETRVYRLEVTRPRPDTGTTGIAEMNVTLHNQPQPEYYVRWDPAGNPIRTEQVGYEPATETANAVEVLNDGTMTRRATIVLSGDFPTGFSITEAGTGNVIACATAISATADVPLIINSDTGKMMRGSSNLTNMLTSRQWTNIAPGDSATFGLSAPDASSIAMKARITPKWN